MSNDGSVVIASACSISMEIRLKVVGNWGVSIVGTISQVFHYFSFEGSFGLSCILCSKGGHVRRWIRWSLQRLDGSCAQIWDGEKWVMKPRTEDLGGSQ